MKNIPFIFSFTSVLFLMIFSSCDELISDSDLSESQVAQGLKEALFVSTDTSVTSASKQDGYYQNPQIKILFPDEAAIVQTVLSGIPGGSILIDEVVKKLNRAAESAAVNAKPIIKNAITDITITDAFAILDGEEDAATEFLRSGTESELYNAFKPEIESALIDVGAQQAWTEVINTYNSIPFVTPVNADLADYTTNEALEGLFILIAEEEAKIRKDPLHRVNDILVKVFGS